MAVEYAVPVKVVGVESVETAVRAEEYEILETFARLPVLLVASVGVLVLLVLAKRRDPRLGQGDLAFLSSLGRFQVPTAVVVSRELPADGQHRVLTVEASDVAPPQTETFRSA